jgi:hypothetical protein
LLEIFAALMFEPTRQELSWFIPHLNLKKIRGSPEVAVACRLCLSIRVWTVAPSW